MKCKLCEHREAIKDFHLCEQCKKALESTPIIQSKLKQRRLKKALILFLVVCAGLLLSCSPMVVNHSWDESYVVIDNTEKQHPMDSIYKWLDNYSLEYRVYVRNLNDTIVIEPKDAGNCLIIAENADMYKPLTVLLLTLLTIAGLIVLCVFLKNIIKRNDN